MTAESTRPIASWGETVTSASTVGGGIGTHLTSILKATYGSAASLFNTVLGRTEYTPDAIRDYASKLVRSPTVSPLGRELYRRLAAMLFQAQLQHHVKVVLVTSAGAGEGKTLTTTNLALTLGDSYRKRVLLIDADLRRPMVHKLLELPNAPGLRTALDTGQLPVIQAGENLSVILAGQSVDDPMEMLASDRMRRLVAAAREQFDWVLIDTPPVALLPDASVLVSSCDIALLVVMASKTPFDVIRSAVETIGRDRIFGVVLNGIVESALARSYADYYGVSR